AIPDYEEATKLDPKDAAAFFERASAYRSKADLERAKQALESTLKLAPKVTFAIEALAEVNNLIAKKSAPPPAPTVPAALPAAPALPPAPACLATRDHLMIVVPGSARIPVIVWFICSRFAN